MRKFALFIILAVVASFTAFMTMKSEKAQANPATSIVASGPQSFPPSITEKAACFGWGPRCGPGRHWVCGPYGRHCWCARC